jgi:hypothetical protein
VSFIFHDPPIKYKLYTPSNEEEAKKAIEDPDVTHLWIFGHGVKHGLTVGKKMLYYCEVKSIPPKEFIGQYHCNFLGGKSLGDYNHPLKSDITDDKIRNIEVNYRVWKSLETLNITPRTLTTRIFIEAILKRGCKFLKFFLSKDIRYF